MNQNFRYSVAFIGYGEAAYNISLGMSKEHPTKMIAFDMMHNDPERGHLSEPVLWAACKLIAPEV